jgi:hypothetical protein
MEKFIRCAFILLFVAVQAVGVAGYSVSAASSQCGREVYASSGTLIATAALLTLNDSGLIQTFISLDMQVKKS